VELLWTLRSHSLVKSEDQDELSPPWVIQKTKLRGYPLIISTSLSSSLEVLHLMVVSLYHSDLQFSTIPFRSGKLPGCCTSSKNVYLAFSWSVLTKAKIAYGLSPYSLLLFSWFSLQNLKRCFSAKHCMLAPRTWWDHTSQWIRMAFLYGLLMHFIGVNKVDSVRGTCIFKEQKVAL
jgi:hypothetical protein